MDFSDADLDPDQNGTLRELYKDLAEKIIHINNNGNLRVNDKNFAKFDVGHPLYFIKCDIEAIGVDPERLEKGLLSMLDDATNNRCGTIFFDDFGKRFSPDDEIDILALDDLVGTTVSVLIDYIRAHSEEAIPQITFYISDYRRLIAFEAFCRHWLKERKSTIDFMKLSKKTENVLEIVKTKSMPFAQQIMYAVSYFDDGLPILLVGDTGVGKGHLARALHLAWKGTTNHFIPVNCAALPEGIQDSEIFGHVKGAYTGAEDDREGAIELANDGTLFLDEIGDASLSLQNKLLHYLDDHTYRKLGDDKILESSAKIIFGTNKDLQELVENKVFKRDLYYRVAGKVITIPELSKRREDIPMIARGILTEIDAEREKNGKSVFPIDEGVYEKLKDFGWKGNVRELKNYLESLPHFAAVINLARIDVSAIEMFPPPEWKHGQPPNLLRELRTLIHNLIDEYLKYWMRKGKKESGLPALDELLKSVAALEAMQHFKEPGMTYKDWDAFLGIVRSSGKPSPFEKSCAMYEQVETIIASF